jgi:KDO2-lipid IV(A) lauroyltransferase
VARHRHPVRDRLALAALRALLGIGGRMPLSMLSAGGTVLGRLFFALAGRDRARADASLSAAFPELDNAARSTLLKAFSRHLGLILAEVAWLWRATPADVRRMCTMNGREHLQHAMDAGTGAVLITGHLGNWEMLNACLGAEGIPMSIAVRQVDDERVDSIASHLRSRHGAEVVHRGAQAGRRLIRAVLSNRVVGLLIDQDIRDIPGTFVPFFGRPAWSPTGAAVIALKTGAPVIPAFIHRDGSGRHIATIEAPLPRPDTGDFQNDVERLTAECTTAVERAIRRHPEQWVWMHRRWKTTPEDIARRDGSA